MAYRDVQLTQISGPIWIDDEQAMFGRWVAQQDNKWLPRGQKPVTRVGPWREFSAARSTATAWSSWASSPTTASRATSPGADLATCDRELTGKTRNLHGRISAHVDLHGAGRTPTGLAGQGSLHLVEANIYELPAMVAVLKTFSLKPPDPNAFSTSDGDFEIKDGQVIFNKLNFNGDAISLSGKGEVDFQGDMSMVFRAKLGRGDAGIPVVRDIQNLLAGAGQQIMQIRVTGNIQDPKVKTEALPGVNQALKNLQDQGAHP